MILMGFLTWSDVTGKLWAVLLFLAILIVFILIIMKIVPEMQFVSDIVGRLER